MFEDGGRFVAAACGAPAESAPAAVEPSELSAAELVDRFADWQRVQRAAVAAELTVLAEFDARQRAADERAGVGERLTGRTVAVQVSLASGISATAGAGRVAFARTLVDELPAILRLAAEGLLGEWHLRHVVIATEQLSPQLRRVVASQLAAELRARESRGVKPLTAHEVGQAAVRRAIAVDPEAATRRFERARRVREVSVTNKVDGTAALWVKGPAEQTQHMYDEVERDARARRHDGDPRSLDELMFEQIYESVLGAMPTAEPGPMPTPHEAPDLAPGDLGVDDPAHDSYADDSTAVPAPPRRRLVPRRRTVEAQIVIGVSTTVGLDELPALLRGYGAIPAEIARQIADPSCDGDRGRLAVRRLLCDPLDGRLVTMESSARLFAGPLRQFAIFRDQSCRVTGGTIREVDHIVPAVREGPTSARNGECLAKNPHVLRDHPGVSVHTVPPDDPLRANAPDIEWTFPTGHTYRSEPPPALGHGSMDTGIHAPPPPPRPSEAEQDAALARRMEQIKQALARRRALHRQRLATPSVMERDLYLAMYMDPRFTYWG